MYVFEFTDQAIKLYNKKKSILYIEPIRDNIIVNNKIYDYLKLANELKRIVNKYQIINNIFRIKVKVLLFGNYNPTDYYLIKLLFKECISNVLVELIYVNKIFDENHIFISGELLYYDNKVLNNLPKGRYYLVGNSANYDTIKKTLIKKYKVTLLEYENSNTIIFEKV